MPILTDAYDTFTGSVVIPGGGSTVTVGAFNYSDQHTTLALRAITWLNLHLTSCEGWLLAPDFPIPADGFRRRAINRMNMPRDFNANNDNSNFTICNLTPET
jgi:hypothetical protein